MTNGASRSAEGSEVEEEQKIICYVCGERVYRDYLRPHDSDYPGAHRQCVLKGKKADRTPEEE